MLRLIVIAAVVAVARADYKCPAPGLAPFNCPQLPTPPPAANVRQLRPGNIKAIGALGDSITAAFAAVGDEPLEFRGVSHQTGGDDFTGLGSHTVHNFLKQYSPDIQGGCTGTTIPLTKRGKGLNTAVSGAVIQDVPAQIDRMVELLNGEYKSVKDEWKMVTLFIGANNICGACDANREKDKPATFENELRGVLTKMRQEIPKVFVNVMTIFNISSVWENAQSTLYCKEAVPILHECNCLNKNATQRQLMDDVTPAYNAASRKVVAEFAAMGDANFTAVVQPGVENENFSTWGEDYLSNLDCFHPSLCSHQGFAVMTWNNMFQPVGKKDTGANTSPSNPPKIYCPTADDVFQ